MVDLIQKYAVLNKSVSIKEWGTLTLLPLSAHVDFPNRLLHAPSYTCSFQTNGITDYFFLNWLSAELGLPVEAAIEKLGVFVIEFYQHLAFTKKIEWSGWGSFTKNAEGILTFQPQFSNKIIPKAVTAERIIRKGAEHSVLVGEEERTNVEMEEFLHSGEKKKKPLWGLFALSLFVIGIIFAWYFANNYNNLWNQNSNYLKLQLKDPPVLYKKP